MPDKPKYTDKDLKKLLQGIHDGLITQRNLPKDLYFAIADYLKKGLYEGFGTNLEDVAADSVELLTDLRENLYLFSAAKTYQFTGECVDLLVDDEGELKPFKQFFEEGKVINARYNEDWARAEYTTTIGQAQMAQRWQDIEKQKDVLPMLMFSTNGRPCPECDPFEGLTAPVNSSVWNKCTPLLHFNCMCILEQHDEDKAPSTQAYIDKLPIDDIPKLFQNNPGKTGEVFTKEHPYYDVPKEDKKFAKTNFGLDIPDKD